MAVLARRPHGPQASGQALRRGDTKEGPIFTIGNLAQRAGMSTDSIRFYEHMGLMRPAARTEAGYRLYTPDALHRLTFIKHAQRCGISLAEVRVLLDAAESDSDDARVEAACRLARSKQAAIAETMTALHAMSEALSSLLSWRTKLGASWPREACPLLPAFVSGIAARAPEASLVSRSNARPGEERV